MEAESRASLDRPGRARLSSRLMKSIPLGRVAGLRLTLVPLAFVGSALLWLVFALGGFLTIGLAPGPAIIGGAIAVLLHWVGDLVHHAGHAVAARSTGYPMAGIDVGVPFGIFAASRYPADEGELPAAIHLRRALGGPIASTILAAILGLVAYLGHPAGGLLRALVLFACAENVLIFTFQVALPLGFNDGGTIWRIILRKR